MIKIKQLTIKNFLSVGAVTQAIRLDDAPLTLILGANSDANGGITRNGAGKSTILQAISYALYSKPLTKIKIPNLINNINTKAMLVTIEFERDGKSFKIERGKKPDVMKFFVNNEEQKLETDETQGENRHTQVEIERLIGMSHNMFKQIVALNTFTDPFLKLPTADQRALVEELLGVTQISTRAETLKKLINNTKEDIRDQEAAIKATSEANDRIVNAIRQAQAKRDAWTSNHDTRIAVLASQLEESIAIDFDAEIESITALEAFQTQERELSVVLDEAQREHAMLSREHQSLLREVEGLERAVGADVGAQITRLKNDQTRRLGEAKRHEDRANVFWAEFLETEQSLQSADASLCPCCDQGLAGTEHLDKVKENLVVKAKDAKAGAEKERSLAAEMIAEAEALTAEMRRIEADAEQEKTLQAEKVSAKQVEAATVASSLAKQALVVEKATDTLAGLGVKPKTNFRSRDDVYKSRQQRDNLARDLEVEIAKENPHLNQIIDLENTVTAIDYKALNELSDLLKHQEFLHKLLTGKDSFIRKRIIDQNLSYLNTRLNYYLEKLGLPHEVAFQSDLTVDITNLGRDFDFEQLSRGEMNRVIMATSWAFRDVWESMNCSLNLLWVDELLDQGTDGQGVEAALSVLKSMSRDRGKNVFLISHREELQARIDRTLLVRKENGFTTLDTDAA